MGDLVSGVGQKKKGDEIRRSNFAQAKQLRRNASLRRATSQREADDERKTAQLIESQAIAIAAASGGGVNNPTVLKLLADIQGEGEYRALSRMFAGKEEAAGMEAQAKNLRKAGRAAQQIGDLSATATILGGAESRGWI